MKTLFLGLLLIILVALGGLVYRNAVEHPSQPVACPLDAKVCPDGTALAREGLACTFPACPPPNTSIDELGIAYAIPAGYTLFLSDGSQYLREYASAATGSTTEPAYITISEYPIAASSTALATIEATAISGASGAPVPTTSYTSTNIAGRQYTVVAIERFEGTIETAYYLARGADVLRFDAIDHGADWTNPSLDTSTLPAEQALHALLSTLQGE